MNLTSNVPFALGENRTIVCVVSDSIRSDVIL